MYMAEQRNYPIGTQTFSVVRENNCVYIDKTEYVYRLAHSDSRYIFLSRPRRFGKSLFVSTLHAYFEGKKDLFKGLAIDKLETEWTQYPVLHFDMSLGKHLDKESLERYLVNILRENENRLGCPGREGDDVNLRLKDLIKNVCEKTGQKVVILIDEYDAPLLDVVHEDEMLPKLRNVMRNFYSPLKACDPYLRFVFMTGITKFSQLSIFSELNNLNNITLDPEYAAICGISKDELLTQMAPDIELLAAKLGISKEETQERLRAYYDGYHFAWPSPDIYNPFSLLSAFSKGRLSSYWFGTGTPTYLVEMLRKFDVLPQQIRQMRCAPEDFDAPTERMTDVTPLLYQSGYITIKNYSPYSDVYTLDIPNREVLMGLYKNLLINYVKQPAPVRTLVGEMAEMLLTEDMDGALRLMQEVLSTVPYCDNTHYEGHYQQMLYLIFTMLGYYVDVEVHTPKGRVDIVLRSQHRLYIMELKINSSANTAMKQIDLKDYDKRFALCDLPIVKVGINFDTETRTLKDWTIEE